MLKEKFGLCLYEVIFDEQESKEIFIQHDVENELLRKENEQLRKNNVTEDATIKESIKKPNRDKKS